MKILFIGESWLGSCARSLKEAFVRNGAVMLDEVNEDQFIPKARRRWLRGINRLLGAAYRNELYDQIRYRIRIFRPDVVMVYKGFHFNQSFIRELQTLGTTVVNIYPDFSPHAYGAGHRDAVGAYDLVISTKPFHPDLWQSVYGYSNPCVFVPQGYDPQLHLSADELPEQKYDLALVATWRAEYGALMQSLGLLLDGRNIRVAIGGYGWDSHRKDFPESWIFTGGIQGRSYTELLRQAKICIAPLTREVVIDGKRQPGDEDTTRTYELAAAGCFFIHRRTGFVRTLYDEATEVPMFDSAEELAGKILYFLNHSAERECMRLAAQRRAVPAYSMDARAKEILRFIEGYRS